MPRAPQSGVRVLGPYRHGDGFRLVIVEQGRKSFGEVVPSEDEAKRLKRVLERQIAQRSAPTFKEALDRYEEYLTAKGNKERSIETARARIERLFKDRQDQQIVPFTTVQADALFREFQGRKSQYGRPFSVAEMRNVVNAAKTFGRWLVKSKMWRDNALLHLEVLGRAKRGKAQLRIDEARRWLVVAYQLADQDDHGAIAALMTFLMGLRASEVINRIVRDLDDRGQRLWITNAKTEAGNRSCKVPRQLQGYLLKAAAGKGPMEPLLGSGTRFAVRHHVKRICRLAGVMEVCAHSMRGLLASFALEEGAVLADVAAGLGHSSPQVTLMHYAVPGSAEAGSIKRGMAVLEGEGDTVAKALPGG